MTGRDIGIVMEPTQAEEAKGVTIRRTIGSERLVLLDPFLLLDHLSTPPLEGESQQVGFPRHPHRGIETLTYVFSGHVHHKDSLGNDSGVGALGSQWMTAGSGIFHEEYLEIGAEGCEALQIWFNLPANEKMKRPGYVPAHATDIPEVKLESGATVRVVAGEFADKKGPFEGIAVHPAYLDVTLPAGATITLPTSRGETAFAYLVSGKAFFGPNTESQEIQASRLVIFVDGDTVQATASADSEARFIFVSAHPLHEPVLQYRSLVMNTVEQMKQALDDLAEGTFDLHR